jgi:hypothetical protein
VKISLKREGSWLSLDCEEVVIPVGIESEIIAISVINGGEIVVIRHGMAYPNGGECVYSEILGDG